MSGDSSTPARKDHGAAHGRQLGTKHTKRTETPCKSRFLPLALTDTRPESIARGRDLHNAAHRFNTIQHPHLPSLCPAWDGALAIVDPDPGNEVGLLVTRSQHGCRPFWREQPLPPEELPEKLAVDQALVVLLLICRSPLPSRLFLLRIGVIGCNRTAKSLRSRTNPSSPSVGA